MAVKLTWTIRPLRLLWVIGWTTFAVYMFGWLALLPMTMIQFDATLRK